jgi:catechol 2,3-dioxygenase-like lactoylglutathione lyase family enzyme
LSYSSRAIKFATIPVRDQDVSLKFSSEALGLKVDTDQPFTEKQRWIELLVPGAQTGLALFTPQFQSVAFCRDDVFATAKVLKSKAVTFVKEPKTESWGTSSVFRDPDGNMFALSSNTSHK